MVLHYGDIRLMVGQQIVALLVQVRLLYISPINIIYILWWYGVKEKGVMGYVIAGIFIGICIVKWKYYDDFDHRKK